MTFVRSFRGNLGTLCLLAGLAVGGLGYVEFQRAPESLLTYGSIALLLVLAGVLFDIR